MDDKFPADMDTEQAEGPDMEAVAILEKFLIADGWHPQQQEEEGDFLAQYVGENGEYRCYFQIHTEFDQFFCYVLAPEPVPEEWRMAAAEYLTRANYGLHIGNFEMDFEDGEVRYKSSLDFENETVTDNWLSGAIYPAVNTMDSYLPGLAAVIAGKSPEAAIAEVEE
jgi:hypothetical protein